MSPKPHIFLQSHLVTPPSSWGVHFPAPRTLAILGPMECSPNTSIFLHLGGQLVEAACDHPETAVLWDGQGLGCYVQRKAKEHQVGGRLSEEASSRGTSRPHSPAYTIRLEWLSWVSLKLLTHKTASKRKWLF